MTGNRYQVDAARTIPKDRNPRERILHGVFGLCSEAGEVAGLFQKQYQGHETDPEHLKKELGDCLWMIAEICTANDWWLEEIMELNIEKLKARYPQGFEVNRSLFRSEDDI